MIETMSGRFCVKHGHFIGDKPSPTYKSWQAMIARCTNPKHPAYSTYHGAGITVCDRWLNSFQAFLEDMGERSEGKTLDRHPNKGGSYEPNNCRWATASQQQRNRSDNALYDFFGEMLTAAEIYEKSGYKKSLNSLRQKLRRGRSLSAILAAIAVVFFAPLKSWPHDIYTGLHGKNQQLCCGGDDCAATIYRERHGAFEFLTREHEWVEIPAERITFLPIPGDPPSTESHRAHLCYRSATEFDRTGRNKDNVFGGLFLYCAFIPPGGV